MRILNFHPKRFPSFYGWNIMAVGTLGVLCSLPGQTIGVAAFTEPLLEVLGLTRTQMSLAYMIGTMSSAFLLTFAGMAYDRFGARCTAAAACVGLGCVLLALSRVDLIVEQVGRWMPFLSPTHVAFGVILLLFFLLRFSGQGVLTMVSRNMMMKWFDRYRGWVTGITGLVIAPMFAVAPMLLNQSVVRTGWRETWWLLGGVCGFGFALVALLFFRDHPEDYGLLPDGPFRNRARKQTRPEPSVPPAFTLAEAIRTFRFWIFAIGISLSGFYITGLSFNIASVFETSGYSEAQGFAVFLPGAIIALVLRPFVGWSADRVALKYILAYMMAALCISGIGLMRLSHPLGIVMLVAGNGMAGSAFDPLMSVSWPNLFGRKHLGAFSGLAMSVTVFSSALGPVAYSLCFSYTGAYALSGLGVVLISALFLGLALCLQET
jgi:OFA family oxalate/formate antiporter-like MFS transporter